jgi:hypothetical protein
MIHIKAYGREKTTQVKILDIIEPLSITAIQTPDRQGIGVFNLDLLTKGGKVLCRVACKNTKQRQTILYKILAEYDFELTTPIERKENE